MARANRKSSTRSASKAPEIAADTYKLRDVHCDVSNLAHLLDVIVGTLTGNTVDSDEIQCERATSLAWIARDLADTMKRNLDAGGGT